MTEAKGETEREKQIERLPTGNTREISVKSTLEEDGLKLSVCSFLNVKSFSDRGMGVGHFIFIFCLFISCHMNSLCFNNIFVTALI